MERITLVLQVNLDPTPGAFHTEESAREIIETILIQRLPHYFPSVNFEK